MTALSLALSAFTILAIMGMIQAVDIFRGAYTEKTFAVAHGLLSLVGSAIVIFATLTGGDERAWINIGLAVVIPGLGLLLSKRRSERLPIKTLVVAHGGLAVVCSAWLAFIVYVKA